MNAFQQMPNLHISSQAQNKPKSKIWEYDIL